MTFTVTYRAKDGALREERIEAASRAECVAECRKRGIAPTKIAEGESGKSAASPNGRDKRGPSRAGAILAAVVIAAVAGGLWWWFGGRGTTALPEKVPAKPKVEKPKAEKPPKPAAKPAVTNVPPVVTNTPPTKEEKRAAQLKAIRDKYGDNIPENLKSVVYFLENPPQRTFHPSQSKESIFKRRSEREIASMVTAEPGTWFMRKPTFNERFDEDFRASLGEKIEISDDDTEEQKALKQAVIDTKAELAERMKAGETPSAVMGAHADAMYELGQYRRMIQDELGKLKRDAQYSDRDIEDFVNAANKMLKDKGAKPIPMPKMVFRHVSLKKAAARAEEKARQEQKEQK